MHITGVLFDIDGTVLDTERIYMESWRLAAAEHGFPMPDIALAKTRAVSREIGEQIFKHYCGEDFNYLEIWKRRVEISEEIIRERDPESLIKPGVLPLFAFLEQHGIKKAVASMTVTSRTYSHLASAGLRDRFDAIVTGDEVKNGKPDPEIFLTAAKKLGLPPEECVVCEDARSGIRAGQKSGAKVFFIPDAVPAEEEDKAFCYALLGTLYEAPALLRELDRSIK